MQDKNENIAIQSGITHICLFFFQLRFIHSDVICVILICQKVNIVSESHHLNGHTWIEFLPILVENRPLGLWPIKLRYLSEVSAFESWAAHSCVKPVLHPTCTGANSELVVHYSGDSWRTEQFWLCQIYLRVGNWYRTRIKKLDLLPKGWGSAHWPLFVGRGTGLSCWRGNNALQSPSSLLLLKSIRMKSEVTNCSECTSNCC